MLDSFHAIRQDIAARLADGASDRSSAMHTPVVATQDADLRIMVLRAFDPSDWTLRFHTDVRAPKVAAVGRGGPVGVLAYDKGAKVQLRLRGRGTILTQGALVDDVWRGSDAYARRCYLGDAPGAAADRPVSGLPEAMEGVRPSETELVPARRNFAVLLVHIERADWFSLAHTGHRRAILSGKDLRNGSWLAP